MSEGVTVALIGVIGTIVGSVATIIAARINSASKSAPEKPETTPVLGEAIDIRELRILRALFGEPRGRFLEGYQDAYYGPALQSMIKKGWVKRNGKRHVLSSKGAEFCRAYLKELFGTWKPADGSRA